MNSIDLDLLEEIVSLFKNAKSEIQAIEQSEWQSLIPFLSIHLVLPYYFL